MRSYPSRCWPFLFIMFSSVLLPMGELQYHTSSFCGWNFVDTSLGRWNRAYRLGFRCLRKLSRVFTGQCFELGTSNILRWICQGYQNLINQVFTWMFYKIYKGLVGISLPPEISHTTRIIRSPNCVSFHQLTTLNNAYKFSFYPKSIRYTFL